MLKPISPVFLTVLCILALSSVARAQKGMYSMMDMAPLMAQSETECFTLPNFQQLFIDSCLEVLKDFKNPNETCQMAWEAFVGAFAFKDPNEVELSDYEEYFNILKIESEPNSVVFWSDVLGLVQEVSKTNKYPVSSSFTQHGSNIINNMAEYPMCWCGGPGGINYTSPCPNKPSTSFWAEVSCLLGESASGISFWLGNGDRAGGAYGSTSFFANYEFPKLQPPEDTKVVVIDVHKNGTGEACGQGSLEDLRNLVVDKFGEDGYTCYDVYGNATDKEEVMNLSKEVLEIIGEEQGGTGALQSTIQLLALLPLLAHVTVSLF